MKSILIILISLILISCGNEKLRSDCFYNTEHVYKGNICNGRKDEWTRTYTLDSSSVIYACNQSFNTKFIIANDSLNIVYKELEFQDAKIDPWILTYDNKNIIGIKESSSDNEKMEIVSINLTTKLMKTLYGLPKYTYWFSEHPLSKNGILIFTDQDNKVIVFDTNTGKLNKSFFINNFPIISKDGKRTLLIDGEDVYLYDIKTLFKTKNMKREFIYSSKDDGGFDVVHAYFGKDSEIIVSGVKNPNFKPLQKGQERIIKDGKVVEKGQMDLSNGYRYY